jgi:hypothetical protein
VAHPTQSGAGRHGAGGSLDLDGGRACRPARAQASEHAARVETADEARRAINSNTAGVAFVLSHNNLDYNVDLKTMITIAHAAEVVGMDESPCVNPSCIP